MKLSATVARQLDECERLEMAFHPCDTATRRTLLRHSRSSHGDVCNPYRSLYARKAWWETLTPVQQTMAIIYALSQQHPKWVFCGISAAIMYGLCDSFFLSGGRVHVVTTHASDQSSNRWVVRQHLDAAAAEEVTYARGVPVTTIPRTVFDCARLLHFRDSLGIVDAAINRGYRKERLLEYCVQNKHYRNSAKALIAISYGDRLSENGGESLARAQMIALGYEPPQLQVNFFDSIKKRNSRVDYLWREAADEVIIFELHGKQKYLDPEMTKGLSTHELLSAERKRASRLSMHGVRLDDIDINDCLNPRSLYHELEEYEVPHRAGAKLGYVEFNRKVPLPAGWSRYPAPFRVL
jgi:hypothetical protein